MSDELEKAVINGELDGYWAGRIEELLAEIERLKEFEFMYESVSK
jgi:hypothetical protein